jgi:hypothetical protein
MFWEIIAGSSETHKYDTEFSLLQVETDDFVTTVR